MSTSESWSLSTTHARGKISKVLVIRNLVVLVLVIVTKISLVYTCRINFLSMAWWCTTVHRKMNLYFRHVGGLQVGKQNDEKDETTLVSDTERQMLTSMTEADPAHHVERGQASYFGSGARAEARCPKGRERR